MGVKTRRDAAMAETDIYDSFPVSAFWGKPAKKPKIRKPRSERKRKLKLPLWKKAKGRTRYLMYLKSSEWFAPPSQ